MSGDQQCVGVCIVDPQTGACMGCGRMPDDIVDLPTPAPSTSKKIAKAPPLPPQVAAQEPSD